MNNLSPQSPLVASKEEENKERFFESLLALGNVL